MKKQMKFKILFLTLTIFAFSQNGFAGEGIVTTSGFDEAAANQISSCSEAGQKIQTFCTLNPSMKEAQAKSGWLSAFLGGLGIGKTVKSAQTVGNSTLLSLSQIRAACNAATNKCFESCEKEFKDLQAATPPQTEKAKEKQQVANTCKGEQAAMQAAVAGLEIDVNKVLASLAILAQALGLGQNDGNTSVASIDTEEEDECEGKYADLLIKCKAESKPLQSRGGLNLASLNGKPSGSSNLFGEGAVSGEPGGESKDKKKDNPFGNGGFAAAGIGSLGSAGSGGAGAGSGEGAEEGINTDLGSGYMGTGGGGGGGGFGGGSGGRSGSARFGKLALSNSGGLNKAALQRKLNRFSKVNNRKPASVGGANGPFEDNWSIVNKAYKKNTKTMFHQK